MNPPELLYIIGVPGAGKSTFVREVTAGCEVRPGDIGSVGVVGYAHDGQILAVEIGRHREAFSGTDALSMSVLPRALDALDAMRDSGPEWHQVFAEGDRLATLKFFIGARDRGWSVVILHLKVSDQTAAFRRAERGSTQNEGWLRGRTTKVANLARSARAAGFPVLTMFAEDTPAELAAQAATVPVLSRFAPKVSAE